MYVTFAFNVLREIFIALMHVDMREEAGQR